MEVQQVPQKTDRFPEVLDEIQREHELTNDEFAALLEIGTRQLNNWRAGRQKPRWDKAVRLARKFDMSVTDFLGVETT